MKEFGGMAIMSLLLMRLSATVAQTSVTGSDDSCGTVVVTIDTEIATANGLEGLEEHQGTFYRIGKAEDFRPVYKSDGGFVLHYVEDGDDDEQYTYVDALTPAEIANEPDDLSLSTGDLEAFNPQSERRRGLQTHCGYWAIGLKADGGDVAMFPMIKVADCAIFPPNIDGDSEWFHQRCEECDPDAGGLGLVTVSFEDPSCSPTPAPVDTPVFPLPEDTPAPVDAPVVPLPGDTPAPVASPVGSGVFEENGASKLGGGLAAVAAAALGSAASLLANSI